MNTSIGNRSWSGKQATRAVVTGGAGFIGSHLVDLLIDEGYRVTVLDDLSTGTAGNLAHLQDSPSFFFIHGSVLDRALLSEAFKGARYVFHQAAIPSVPRSIEDPYATHEANATGTLLALMAAMDAGVTHFVMASSCAVYGDTPELPLRECSPLSPLSPYAVSKLSAEAYCEAFTRCYDIPTTSLRYFNVYGPRQNPDSEYAAVIPRFIKAALAGEPLTVYGSGEQTRDFCYVTDVARANLLAATQGATGIYNIGSGSTVSIAELARLICAATESRSVPSHLPARPGDIEHSLADVTKATAFNWRPLISLSEGVQRTVAAMKGP